MKIDYLAEPELEFGGGLPHVDIRFGLMQHGPFDSGKADAPQKIKLGIVGNAATIEGLWHWLQSCKQGIAAKVKNKQPNLFPKYPGSTDGSQFCCELVSEANFQRVIAPSEFEGLTRLKDRNARVTAAVDLYLSEIEYLAKKRVVNVIACSIPLSLVSLMEGDDGEPEQGKTARRRSTNFDFHHLLKAKSMAFGVPIQIVLPSTYDESQKLKSKGGRSERTLQDEATRAWNIHVALYYKAGGTPWRLRRDSAKLRTCFVGISFYEALSRSHVATSIAQVFDELGDGIILRGAKAVLSKDDRTPHLAEQDAATLLESALRVYKREHRTLPARIVIHKTSKFNEEELKGFEAATTKLAISSLECLSLAASHIRLFRKGAYPPHRGTFLSLDDANHVLYTRGSVDFFETYPGMYVPRSLAFCCAKIEQTPRVLATEILELTKMNWNKTQFDSRDPITIRAARQVGNILKYLGDSEPIENRYSFYM